MVDFNMGNQNSKKIKVLFLPLHKIVDSSIGSEVRWALDLALSAAKAGISFKAVVGTIDSYSADLIRNTGNDLLNLNIEKNIFSSENLLEQFKFYKALKNQLAYTNNFDVIHHAFPVGYGAGFNPIIFEKNFRPFVLGPLLYPRDEQLIKYYYKIQGLVPVQTKSQLIFKFFTNQVFMNLHKKTLKRADYIIFDTEETRNKFSTIEPGVLDKKYALLPSCGLEMPIIDLNKKFSATPILNLGILAYFSPLKRIETAIKGMHIANPKNIKLYIYGTGISENYLRKLTKELRLDRKVQFMGSFDNKNLTKVMDTIDGVVHLDINSTLVSATPQDALRYGKPLIFSNMAKINKIIEHPYGFQVDKDNPDIIANLFSILDNNPEKFLEKSESARKFAENNFSYNYVSSVLRSVYESVV